MAFLVFADAVEEDELTLSRTRTEGFSDSAISMALLAPSKLMSTFSTDCCAAPCSGPRVEIPSPSRNVELRTEEGWVCRDGKGARGSSVLLCSSMDP